jgi:hypothetical protein
MRITRSNYERWFLDFLDGNLEPSFMGEFQVFLKENPDLAAELGMVDLVMLEADKKIRFDAKDGLKKIFHAEKIDFEEQAVAYYEGDLSLADRIKFEARISENRDEAGEAKQFGKLKLIADKTIVYESKEKLKKKGAILPLWIKITSVAAVLLLAYLFFQPNVGMQPKHQQLSDNLKNKGLKNVEAPAKNAKVEDKNIEKTTPSVTPKRAPASVPIKKNQKQIKDKTGKKVETVPDLRAPEPNPLPLKSRGISFGHPVDLRLATINPKDTTETSEEFELSELLKVQLAAMRKNGDRDILTGHLGLSGLQLFAKLSGKRLTARKGKDGVVKSISYNSRLLALSIPVNR